MKASELIELLKRADPDAQVVMSSDAEGNSFSPLAEASFPELYVAESTWAGILADEGETEDYSKVEPVICLWPTN